MNPYLDEGTLGLVHHAADIDHTFRHGALLRLVHAQGTLVDQRESNMPCDGNTKQSVNSNCQKQVRSGTSGNFFFLSSLMYNGQ